ncbi:MAG: aminoacetone oxidase family FAD-binding enzyme, partial [Mogibacterium sp.]|nr:aminoacetone oxidase family FAD-binding enzyme [Mogibacterium sp.]
KPYEVEANTVILACGGKAGPSYGTTGDGYRIASALGHQIVTPIPVLTPVECAEDGCEPLKGTRSRGTVTLYRRNGDAFEPVCSEEGEIQFTYYGLSGICVFNLTRHMRYTGKEGIRDFAIGVDLSPDLDILEFLRDRREAERNWPAPSAATAATAESLLRTVLKQNLADYVIQRAGINPACWIVDLSDTELERLAGCVRDLRFRPTGIRGWKDAQCTSGGVSLDEIDPVTQESLLSPGLYIIGELQDYDGPCGGFNLNHAWLTGKAAGKAAALQFAESAN